MNRRKYLKSVFGTLLLPTVSIPKSTEELDFEYLDSLFSEDYIIDKNMDSPLGEVYTAYWSASENKRYSVQYRVFSDNSRYDSRADVYDYSEGFESYTYIPQNHVEALTLTEIGRKQGLDDLLTTLDRLNLENEIEVEHE